MTSYSSFALKCYYNCQSYLSQGFVVRSSSPRELITSLEFCLYHEEVRQYVILLHQEHTDLLAVTCFPVSAVVCYIVCCLSIFSFTSVPF